MVQLLTVGMGQEGPDGGMRSRWRRFLPCLVVAAGWMALAGCSGDDDDDASSAIDENLFSGPGDFYSDFLMAEPYSRLLIEIDVVEGGMPDGEAIDTLVQHIEMLCNKPGGIEVRFPDDTIPAGTVENPEYTLEEINGLEAQYRDSYRQGDQAVMYFLYVDGHSHFDDDATQVVGYAYHGSSMAIFMGTVNSQPLLASRVLLEKTVTIHEFGHIAGLVNNGAEMVTAHQDPDSDHGAHCNNAECMMYWLNNGSDLLQYLRSGEIPTFDDNCLADIANAGGKDARSRPQPR